jgi:hypothetical protein
MNLSFSLRKAASMAVTFPRKAHSSDASMMSFVAAMLSTLRCPSTQRGEEELQRSGLDYTIVRPGGLKDGLSPGEQVEGNIVMAGPGTFGVSKPPPTAAGGSRSILRRQVGLLLWTTKAWRGCCLCVSRSVRVKGCDVEVAKLAQFRSVAASITASFISTLCGGALTVHVPAPHPWSSQRSLRCLLRLCTSQRLPTR